VSEIKAEKVAQQKNRNRVFLLPFEKYSKETIFVCEFVKAGNLRKHHRLLGKMSNPVQVTLLVPLLLASKLEK
jgi:hypothetical protein